MDMSSILSGSANDVRKHFTAAVMDLVRVFAETMQPPVGSIAMMQIDCEVTATRLVHIDKSAVPDNMLNNTGSAHQHHHRADFTSHRAWVVSDAEN